MLGRHRFAGLPLGHADHGHERIVFLQVHDPHALRVAAGEADLGRADALDLAASGHHQHFVLVVDADRGHDRAVALGGLDVAHAQAAAPLGRVTLRRGAVLVHFVAGLLEVDSSRSSDSSAISEPSNCPPRIRSLGVRFRLVGLLGPNGVRLPKPLCADGEQLRVGIGHDHAHQAVAAAELDAANAAGAAAHRAHRGLAEADRLPARAGEHDLVARLGDRGIDQLVSFAEVDGDDARASSAGRTASSGVFFTRPFCVAITR